MKRVVSFNADVSFNVELCTLLARHTESEMSTVFIAILAAFLQETGSDCL